MFKWLTRRRLSAEARKKLLIVTARAEEALVETHVENLLELFQALGDEIDLDRGIEIYMEALGLNEQLASTVTNRLLARLESPRVRRTRAEPRRQNVFSDGARRR